VSNDNPYRESQFKTLKYCLTFPGTFASLEQAREFCAEFFYAYNHHHRHAGLGLLTPRSSTAAKPRPSTPGATWFWTRHIPCTAADFADHRSHPSFPAAPGSTSQQRARPPRSNS